VNPELFAQRLRAALKARGFSARRVARESGLHPSSVSRWLHGRGAALRLRESTLQRLETALRLPPGAFEFEEEEWQAALRQPSSRGQIARLSAEQQTLNRMVTELTEHMLRVEAESRARDAELAESLQRQIAEIRALLEAVLVPPRAAGSG